MSSPFQVSAILQEISRLNDTLKSKGLHSDSSSTTTTLPSSSAAAPAVSHTILHREVYSPESRLPLPAREQVLSEYHTQMLASGEIQEIYQSQQDTQRARPPAKLAADPPIHDHSLSCTMSSTAQLASPYTPSLAGIRSAKVASFISAVAEAESGSGGIFSPPAVSAGHSQAPLELQPRRNLFGDVPSPATGAARRISTPWAGGRAPNSAVSTSTPYAPRAPASPNSDCFFDSHQYAARTYASTEPALATPQAPQQHAGEDAPHWSGLHSWGHLSGAGKLPSPELPRTVSRSIAAESRPMPGALHLGSSLAGGSAHTAARHRSWSAASFSTDGSQHAASTGPGHSWVLSSRHAPVSPVSSQGRDGPSGQTTPEQHLAAAQPQAASPATPVHSMVPRTPGGSIAAAAALADSAMDCINSIVQRKRAVAQLRGHHSPALGHTASSDDEAEAAGRSSDVAASTSNFAFGSDDAPGSYDDAASPRLVAASKQPGSNFTTPSSSAGDFRAPHLASPQHQLPHSSASMLQRNPVTWASPEAFIAAAAQRAGGTAYGPGSAPRDAAPRAMSMGPQAGQSGLSSPGSSLDHRSLAARTWQPDQPASRRSSASFAGTRTPPLRMASYQSTPAGSEGGYEFAELPAPSRETLLAFVQGPSSGGLFNAEQLEHAGRMDRELLQDMYQLSTGLLALKHGRKGSAHRRCVWLDDSYNGLAFRWDAPSVKDAVAAGKPPEARMGKPGEGTERTLPLAALEKVHIGRGSDVLERSAKPQAAACCVSFQAAGRTLDLQLPTQANRDSLARSIARLCLVPGLLAEAMFELKERGALPKHLHSQLMM